MVLALALGLNLSDPWLKEVNSPDLLPQALLKSFPPSLNLLPLIPPLLLLPSPLPCLLVLPPLVQPEQEPPGLLPLEPLRKSARNQGAGVFFSHPNLRQPDHLLWPVRLPHKGGEGIVSTSTQPE